MISKVKAEYENPIKTAYKSERIRVISSERVNDAELEIDKLHSDEGFIIFALKGANKKDVWYQYTLRKQKVTNKFLYNLLSLNENTYMTINSFKNHNRLTSNVYSLNALWADIDYYNIPKYRNCSYIQMVEIISKNKLIKKIPPSFYVFSGNGIYLIWLIENAHNSCINIWKALMKRINEELEKYGADQNAIDVTRVLRLSGSKNTKTNKKAFIIRDCFSEEFKRYTIAELTEKVLPPLPYTKEEWKNLKDKKRKTKKDKESCKVVKALNIHHLNFSRMKDIQKLIEIRNGDCKGTREVMLFLYRYWGNCFWGDNERALEEIVRLNQLFTQPLSEYNVVETTARAEEASFIWEKKLEEYWNLKYKPSVRTFFEKTGCYVYSNKKLIEILKITKEEMKSLETIIDTAEKNRRNKSYRKQWKRENDAAYDRGKRRNENGLTKREQSKLDKVKIIKELKAQGFKQIEIAEKLGITKGTVSKYLKINTDTEHQMEFNTILLDKVTDSEISLLAN